MSGVQGSGARSGRSSSVRRRRPPRSSGTSKRKTLSSGTSTSCDQHGQQIGWDRAGDLQAHRLTEAAPVELELDRGQEVLGLVLLDREVGVAGHPERVVLDDAPSPGRALRGGRR